MNSVFAELKKKKDDDDEKKGYVDDDKDDCFWYVTKYEKDPTNDGRFVQCDVCKFYVKTKQLSKHSTDHPSHIEGSLYLGDYESGRDAALLKKLGVKRIVNCARECLNHFEDEFTYVALKRNDDDCEQIKEDFHRAISFMDEGLTNGEGVYVHCMAGISRSSTIVVAFIMNKKKLNAKQALQYVIERRSIVSPNRGFLLQLLAYEKELYLNAGGDPSTYQPSFQLKQWSWEGFKE